MTSSESLRKQTDDGDHEWGEVPPEWPVEEYLPIRTINRRDVPEFSQIERVTQDPDGTLRIFTSGATRDTDTDKLDYEAFFSPRVIRARAEYMHEHRKQADGSLRAGDNWQKGIPLDEYMKSGWRHFWGWWARHRKVNLAPESSIKTDICGLMFNLEGYLDTLLREEEGCTP